MKIQIIDTYYPQFLANCYNVAPEWSELTYSQQRDKLLGQCFGTADFYSRHLQELGWDADDVIANCRPLQKAWAQENGVRYFPWMLSHRFLQIPLLRSLLARLPGVVEVAMAQVEKFRPDILYCQDLSFFSPQALQELKPYVKKIVGQIASPLPAAEYLRGYDLILTSFPHYVARLHAQGLAAEYFPIGFDPLVLDQLGSVSRTIPVSFVGGLSRHHNQAMETLEYLAQHTPIEFFGYGKDSLDRSSPIWPRHRGEVWGLNMYSTLARSRITLNRHINVAENNANNMRLYEATGMGALLVTDKKDNLSDIFVVGEEVVAYGSKEEAAELVAYYIAHPDEAEKIAQAGQRRTLRDHTYQKRMAQLDVILRRCLGAR